MALLPLMAVQSRVTGSRAVSLPFSDFCSPLLFNRSAAKAVEKEITDLRSARRWKHVEVRGGDQDLWRGAVPGDRFYAHKLSLGRSADDLWKQLASPVRRAIRKAGRSGVSAEASTTLHSVRKFYELHCQTRRRHGIAPQPFRFFRNIFKEIISQDRGFIVLAKAGSCSIAAAMFFEFNGTAIYKFGASDESAQELRANNLVMWEAIRLLAERGCRILHFGRTELGNEGLRRFKRGWGTIEEIIQYFRFGGPAPAAEETERTSVPFYHSIFRKLPLPLNRLAGALIYPHLD